MKEIELTNLPNIKIGNVTDEEHGTGVTVFLTDHGAVTGLDVRGGAPASRESALLNPLAANDRVDAVVLAGGSAFGLDAAAGVMQYLEERHQGWPVAEGVVPIVCASCLYDLEVADSRIRPSAKDGYRTCQLAGNYQDGNYGAGTGATVGKILGSEHMMKAGIGSYALQEGDLMVAAVVAVNAAGNVVDPNNRPLAGVRDENNQIINAEEALSHSLLMPGTNTTIGVILTNGAFNKTELTKIAGMGHDGYARAIYPVHTKWDGDSLYAMSYGNVTSDLNIAGALGAKAVAAAIDNAVLHTESAYGLKCAEDFQ